MNRCGICGRFCRWDQLRFQSQTRMVDVYGGVDESEWFECGTCSPSLFATPLWTAPVMMKAKEAGV